MRIAVLLVALLTIVVGVMGIVSPDSLTTVRRLYFATPARLYAAGAVRVAMGLVLILVAPVSRAPKTLRALGAIVCVQGLASALGPQFVGVDRARAVLELEVKQGLAFLRVGAVVALAIGGFVAFATRGRPRDGTRTERGDEHDVIA